jgi:beta-fructofuranosidase
MNDPMGITWRGDRYHLFFQNIPESPVWKRGCHWGHATSSDLLAWTPLPPVLSPGDGDSGCWTGCLFTPGEGAPDTALYTSVDDQWRIGRVRAATANDADWQTWTKGDVVAEAPAGLRLSNFRDPFVFRDNDGWRMLVGAGLEDGTACALTYTRHPAHGWEYTGILAQRSGTLRDPVWTGAVWECPQLLQLEDSYVLIVSVWADDHTHYVAAAVGDYDNATFHARTWQQLTYGDGHYAASTFRDADGRPCLMMWVRGLGDPEGTWQGAQSIPMQLSLTDGNLAVRPHPNLTARRAPGEGSSPSWDLEWHHPVDATIGFQDTAGTTLVRVNTTPDGLVVSPGAAPPTAVPHHGRVTRLVVDGPLLELFTGAHTAAFVMPWPHGPSHFDLDNRSTAQAWHLREAAGVRTPATRPG